MTPYQLMGLIEAEVGPQKPPGYGQPAAPSEWGDWGP